MNQRRYGLIPYFPKYQIIQVIQPVRVDSLISSEFKLKTKLIDSLDIVSTSPSLTILNQTHTNDNNTGLEIISNVDRVIFNKEHVGSNIIPKLNPSILHKQYQITESKLIQRLPMTLPQELQGTQLPSTSSDVEKLDTSDRNEHQNARTEEENSSALVQSTIDEQTLLHKESIELLQQPSDVTMVRLALH